MLIRSTRRFIASAGVLFKIKILYQARDRPRFTERAIFVREFDVRVLLSLSGRQ